MCRVPGMQTAWDCRIYLHIADALRHSLTTTVILVVSYMLMLTGRLVWVKGRCVQGKALPRH